MIAAVERLTRFSTEGRPETAVSDVLPVEKCPIGSIRKAHANGIHRKRLPSSPTGGKEDRIDAKTAIRASAAATAAAAPGFRTVRTPTATAAAATPTTARTRHRSSRPDQPPAGGRALHILADVSRCRIFPRSP